MRSIVLVYTSLLFVLSFSLISTPFAFAILGVQISLGAPSCALYPLAGTTSCSVNCPNYCNFATDNADTGGQKTLTWSYDTTHLSVIVDKQPAGDVITSPYYFTTTDVTFNLKVTYSASSCTNGTYNVSFSLVRSDGAHSSAIFSAIVHCAFLLG